MPDGRDYGKLTAALIDDLRGIAGQENVVTDEGRENYAHDEAPHSRTGLPEAVVKAPSTAAVTRTMQLASTHRIPVTPRGAGTGIAGGAVPIFGGIVLSLEKMDRVLEIDDANFSATCEAGVTLNALCAALADRGLYYPLYPGEMSATVGGNVATNAGGMRAVKYGVTRNFVMGLEAVLPGGDVIQTGGKYFKSSTGYDLTQLITGSEGTLAVITKVTLRLIAPPGSREILCAPFQSLEKAIQCVPAILKSPILPVGIEFMEQDVLKAVADYTGKSPLPHELEGHPAYLMIMVEAIDHDDFTRMAEQLSRICQDNGAVDVFVPGSERAKRSLLEAREMFYPTMQHRNMLDIADVVVPRSQIATFVKRVKELSRQAGIQVIAYGHAGDGNVHLHPVGRGVDQSRVDGLLVEIYQSGLALGGTISGEHGLGLDKKGYLRLAEPPAKIELLKRLKQAFDPLGIMNPGKVIDWGA